MKILTELNHKLILTRTEMKNVRGGEANACALKGQNCKTVACCAGLICVTWPNFPVDGGNHRECAPLA
jgi:hypothetical protein